MRGLPRESKIPLFVLVAFATLVAAPAARADRPHLGADDPDDADELDEAEAAQRALFDRALEDYEAGRHALAIASFEALYEQMIGHPRRFVLLYNIGRSHEALGHPRRAIAAYRDYLASERVDAPDRESVESRLRELRRRLELDEQFERAAEESDSEGGHPASPESEAAPPEGGPTDLHPEPISLTFAGVGLAFALSGAALGLMVEEGMGELRAACDLEAATCPASERGRARELEELALYVDVFLVGGAALLGAGLALSFGLADLHPFGGEPDREASGEAEGAIQLTSLAPSCTDRGCALVVRGELR